jgi:hypothetical protein
MAPLYEDSDYIDQLEGQPQDRLFFEGSHLPGKFNRYEPGYSSRPPQRESESQYQDWQLAPLGGYGHDEPGYYPDDELRRMVEKSIQADPRLSSEEKNAIQVEVKDKEIILSGMVQRANSKAQAESDAYWTQGIGKVKNQIEVSQKGNR